MLNPILFKSLTLFTDNCTPYPSFRLRDFFLSKIDTWYLGFFLKIEIIILTFFIVFLISLISVQNYLKLYGNKDHQSIVIDEFLGQYIALFSIPLFELENNIINITIIFLLFRFFDISKIGLKSVEKIPGIFGILFDDIIGGIYTIPIIYLVFLWFGKI